MYQIRHLTAAAACTKLSAFEWASKHARERIFRRAIAKKVNVHVKLYVHSYFSCREGTKCTEFGIEPLPLRAPSSRRSNGRQTTPVNVFFAERLHKK